MNTLLIRLFAVMLLTLAVWPEFERYRAEYQLAEAGDRLERVLQGQDREAAAIASAQRAAELAGDAGRSLPADARPALIQGLALILLRQGEAAAKVLQAAIDLGERPELSINLGRARAVLGDEAGARRAFLRTAWASPGSIATLPRQLRDELRAEVQVLETELRAGQLQQPPPL